MIGYIAFCLSLECISDCFSNWKGIKLGKFAGQLEKSWEKEICKKI